VLAAEPQIAEAARAQMTPEFLFRFRHILAERSGIWMGASHALKSSPLRPFGPAPPLKGRGSAVNYSV
jgi:hypothetical protein